jgi:drug/metabolite transporter (DMT)-like permease|tara:strand:+ start:1270 stop:2067 length:798 start_codon:yes stop_codon:yes gene_type:complete
MPLEVVLLVLVSSVIHAGWNARLHRMENPEVVIVMAYLCVGVVLLPAAVVDPPVEVLGWTFASTAAQAVYVGCLGSAYRDGSLSVAYPIARGTAPLLVGLGGWWLLGETPSAATSIGLVVLTVGLLLVAGLGARLREGRAIAMALFTGLGTVAYSLIDARSVDLTGVLGYLSVIMVLSSLVVLAVRRPGAERIRASLWPGALIGVGQGSAYALILLAFQQAQAGQVAGLRQVSVVIGVLLAREALGPRAVGGALAVAVGAALVVW